MAKETSERKLAKAKSLLILEHPFFATLACQLPWIRRDDIPTMATDGNNIFWNDEFVQGMSAEEVKFVVCHEIMHCVFQHCERLRERNMRRWNVATDYVINKLLSEENIGAMPEGGLRDDAIVNKCQGSADRIYNELPDDEDGNGDGQGDGFDTLMPGSPDPATASANAAKIKVAVAQAAQAAKMAGKLSAGLKRFVDEQLESKVDWRQVLRDFVASKAKVDISYSKLNRRFLHDDILLPSYDGEALGHIVVAVDCSGSIGQREISEFAAEIRAIHQDHRPEHLHVMYFDHGISHIDEYGPDDEIDIQPHGGGGTAFSPIFKKIDELGIQPVGVVVLTDLYCDDFGNVPGAPVLWVCNSSQTKVPWGRVVPMHK